MTDSPHLHGAPSPLDYYSSLGGGPSLREKFHNIDDELNFKNYIRDLQSIHTQNFVLEFGNEDAWCALNLDQDDMTHLLRRPTKPKYFGTRWIHIWAPEEQKESIKTITSHYGLSERLQGMMCTDPVQRSSEPTAVPAPPSRASIHTNAMDRSPRIPDIDDLEEAYALKDMAESGEAQVAASFRGLTFSHVTNQIWHFCSVDYGPKYTCVGYNSLHVVPNMDVSNGKHLPDGIRLWSWLILCDDGTVISMQENPFPGPQNPSEKELKAVLSIVRRNIQFIFSGVSHQHSVSSESDSLVTIRVRPSHNDHEGDHASIKQDDGPSLLFYYIFDDWVSSYALVAKREHKYGVLLDKLRGNMLSKPAVDLVNELHGLGRQLAVLKRLYSSYELIMTRILQRQRQLRDEARSSRPPVPLSTTIGEREFVDIHQATRTNSMSFANIPDTNVGVQLSSGAVARFERLLDRIKLYCLSEIETCLVEKESLTFLNFNLIALKDSQAVEKLTRITVLLAKLTMLFLPVSLMTAYFSTELQNVKGVYTVTQYWAAFGVIMGLSIMLLALFGFLSDTVEGKTIYQSLFRTFFRSSKDRMAHRREKGD
ncbi:hypothetical protein FE257_007010 [Aspergillus nanangensis]|uniref:ADP-ribosylation factor n=1 Tax=Aspergillus nanangensis TaxID=2582783 RepID=A0AAD4CNC2_ASPNN|nr:hypothetical protein FE257_007010 [Aspergillus nanangensis]